MGNPAVMATVPTLSVGNRSRSGAETGVTLIELLVVVALIAILVGISFPSITSGIDSIRLNSAINNVVTFVNTGLNFAERRQQVVEVTISKADNTLSLRSSDPSFVKKLNLPDGVTISSVLPELPEGGENAPRSFLLYPGGTVPGFGVVLVNRRHMQRLVRVDPMTGVPQVQSIEQEADN